MYSLSFPVIAKLSSYWALALLIFSLHNFIPALKSSWVPCPFFQNSSKRIHKSLFFLSSWRSTLFIHFTCEIITAKLSPDLGKKSSHEAEIYMLLCSLRDESHTKPPGPVEHLPTDAMGSPINSSDPKAASYWGNPTVRCLPKSLCLGEWYFTPLHVEEMKPLTCSVLDASRSLVISWCADTIVPRWVPWLPTKWGMQETAANPHAAAQHIRCPTSGHDEPDNAEQHLCFAGGNLCTCTLNSGNNFFVSSQTFFWNTDNGVKNYLKPLACAWASWSRSVFPAEKHWC